MFYCIGNCQTFLFLFTHIFFFFFFFICLRRYFTTRQFRGKKSKFLQLEREKNKLLNLNINRYAYKNVICTEKIKKIRRRRRRNTHNTQFVSVCPKDFVLRAIAFWVYTFSSLFFQFNTPISFHMENVIA